MKRILLMVYYAEVIGWLRPLHAGQTTWQTYTLGTQVVTRKVNAKECLYWSTMNADIEAIV